MSSSDPSGPHRVELRWLPGDPPERVWNRASAFVTPMSLRVLELERTNWIEDVSDCDYCIESSLLFMGALGSATAGWGQGLTLCYWVSCAPQQGQGLADSCF